ncbi:MAG: outer membrane beta-barrel protein [Muribaculaceae bacterium]|nr:outer membrane beta-barrel protein [Muribaculaceae bacterium]
MMARGASKEIDAIYSNPAGLVWGHEGWQISFNWQGPTQNRDIDANFIYGRDPQTGAPLYFSKHYNGQASAPFVPALFASYKHDRWAIGAMIGIVGSGGFVKYDEGLPMFDQPLMGMLFQRGLTPNMYGFDSQVKGKQYIYGGQVNFNYRITNHLSAAVGFRANYYDGYYRGHVNVNTIPALGNQRLVGLQLDCDQRGWGFNPIISINYHYKKLTLAAKYEFRTKLNIPNSTNALAVEMSGRNIDVKAMAENLGNEATLTALSSSMGSMTDKVSAFLPDEKTRYDMPALLTVAAGFEFTPKLRATVEYHFFDDKNAKMADDRQKELKHGTHEILAGVEYDINKTLTISAGGQRTDYGLSDGYQSNTSFACDSYSVGFGAAINVNEHLRFNLTYFWTMYSDYTKQMATSTETYSRTNRVFGLGVDYKF